MRFLFLVAATLLAIGFAIPVARAQLLADSIADFSGTQGSKNWQYGYYSGSLTPASFQQMTAFYANAWHRAEGGGNAYWTQLWDNGGHPNGPITERTHETNFAVRRWTVPANYSGKVRLYGNVWKQNTGGGDGVICRIFINSQEVYTEPLAFNTTFFSYATFQCIHPFDTIDFAIDPGANDYFDSTRFDVQIWSAFVKQPVSASSCSNAMTEFSAFSTHNDPIRWQFEYTPGNWKNLAVNFQPLACGGRIRCDAPTNSTVNIITTGCAGTSGIPIRCASTGNCGTLFSDVATLKICAADLNCDGFVDDADFQVFVTAYDAFVCSGPGLPANCPSDLNGDGRVDDSDFLRFITSYNTVICP